MNIQEQQTEARIEQPKKEFKSNFKTWIRVVAFILLAVFLPEQVAQAAEYDWSVIWNKPAAGSIAPRYLKDINNIDTALTIRNILKDIANKPINAIKVSSNLTINLDKPLRMSNQRINEITEWLKGRPCGSKALYDYLNHSGVKAAEGDIAIMALTVDILNDVVRPEGRPEVIKSSLYALSEAAKFFKVNLFPVKVDSSIDLSSLTPFIAHFKNEHYVLVTRVSEDKIYYNQDHREEFLPKDTFLAKFSGYALTNILPANLKVLSPAESKKILGARLDDGSGRYPSRTPSAPPPTTRTNSWVSYLPSRQTYGPQTSVRQVTTVRPTTMDTSSGAGAWVPPAGSGSGVTIQFRTPAGNAPVNYTFTYGGVVQRDANDRLYVNGTDRFGKAFQLYLSDASRRSGSVVAGQDLGQTQVRVVDTSRRFGEDPGTVLDYQIRSVETGKWVPLPSSHSISELIGNRTPGAHAETVRNINPTGTLGYSDRLYATLISGTSSSGYSNRAPFLLTVFPNFNASSNTLSLGLSSYFIPGQFYVNRSSGSPARVIDRAINNNVLIKHIPQAQMYQAAREINSRLAASGSQAYWAVHSSYNNMGASISIAASPTLSMASFQSLQPSSLQDLQPILYVVQTNQRGIVPSYTGFADLRQVPSLTKIMEPAVILDGNQQLLGYTGPDKLMYSATINGHGLGLVSPFVNLDWSERGGLQPVFENARFSVVGDALNPAGFGTLRVGVDLTQVDLTKSPTQFHVGLSSNTITGFIPDFAPDEASLRNVPVALNMYSGLETSGMLSTDLNSQGTRYWKVEDTRITGFSNIRSWSGIIDLAQWSLEPKQTELTLNMQNVHLVAGPKGSNLPFAKDVFMPANVAIYATPTQSHFERYGSANYIGLAGGAQMSFTTNASSLDLLNVNITLNNTLSGQEHTFNGMGQAWHQVSLANLSTPATTNIYQPNFGELVDHKALSSAGALLQQIDINGNKVGPAERLDIRMASALTESGVRNIGFTLNAPLKLHASPMIAPLGGAAGLDAMPTLESGSRVFIERGIEAAAEIHKITTPNNIGGVIGLPIQFSTDGIKASLPFGEGTRFWSPEVRISTALDVPKYKDQYVQIGNDYAWNLQGNRIEDGRLSFDMQKASVGSNNFNTAIYNKTFAYDVFTDPFRDRILESVITASPGSLGFGSLALGRLAVGQTGGNVNPAFSIAVLDENVKINQSITNSAGTLIDSVTDLSGTVAMLDDRSLSFKTYGSIFSRPTVYDEQGVSGKAPDSPYSEYSLTKVAGAETIYRMEPKVNLNPHAAYTANLTLGLIAAEEIWKNPQSYASIDFTHRNARIEFGSTGDYALGIQRLGGDFTAAGGLSVSNRDIVLLDRNGGVSTPNTAGYWQPINNRTFTVQFSDAFGQTAVGAFNKRVSWDAAGNITGIDKDARFMTDGLTWRKVIDIDTRGQRLSVQLEHGKQFIYGDFSQGSETNNPVSGPAPVATNFNGLFLTLGADSMVTGQAANYLSNLNYNFSGSIASDLRGATIYNPTIDGYTANNGDYNLVRQFRGQGAGAYAAADAGLIFKPGDLVSFDAVGQLKEAHAGYWQNMAGKSYTASFTDPFGNAALAELNKRVSWDAAGNITGIDKDARFMTDGLTWRKVIDIDTRGQRLSVQLEHGKQFIYGDFSQGSETNNPVSGPAPVATNFNGLFLTLGADSMVTGQAANYLSNLNYNFSGSIASDLRGATIYNPTIDGYTANNGDYNLVRQFRGQGAGAYAAADAGLIFKPGDLVSFDAVGQLKEAHAGYWQPVGGNRYTVLFQDAPDKYGISRATLGEFDTRVSWDAAGNIYGVGYGAKFMTGDSGDWRKVTFIEGGNIDEPLSVTLSDGTQPFYRSLSQGQEMLTSPDSKPTPDTLRAEQSTMYLGSNGLLAGPASNYLSNFNYNFSGTVAQDLRGYSIYNDIYNGDFGMVMQSRNETIVGEGGLIFNGNVCQTISFNKSGQLIGTHAGYLQPVGGNRYTVTLQDAADKLGNTRTALGEFGTRISWDAAGNIAGIDNTARFMTENGVWRDVDAVYGIPKGAQGYYSDLNFTFKDAVGTQPVYLSSTTPPQPGQPAVAQPIFGAGHGPDTLTLTSDGRLLGKSSNFVSNLNYNFTGTIASDLRNYTINSNGYSGNIDYQAINDGGNITGTNQLIFDKNSNSISFDSTGNVLNGMLNQNGSVNVFSDGKIRQARDGSLLLGFAMQAYGSYELEFTDGARQRNKERLEMQQQLMTPGSAVRQELAIAEAQFFELPAVKTAGDALGVVGSVLAPVGTGIHQTWNTFFGAVVQGIGGGVDLYSKAVTSTALMAEEPGLKGFIGQTLLGYNINPTEAQSFAGGAKDYAAGLVEFGFKTRLQGGGLKWFESAESYGNYAEEFETLMHTDFPDTHSNFTVEVAPGNNPIFSGGLFSTYQGGTVDLFNYALEQADIYQASGNIDQPTYYLLKGLGYAGKASYVVLNVAAGEAILGGVGLLGSAASTTTSTVATIGRIATSPYLWAPATSFVANEVSHSSTGHYLSGGDETNIALSFVTGRVISQAAKSIGTARGVLQTASTSTAVTGIKEGLSYVPRVVASTLNTSPVLINANLARGHIVTANSQGRAMNIGESVVNIGSSYALNAGFQSVSQALSITKIAGRPVAQSLGRLLTLGKVASPATQAIVGRTVLNFALNEAVLQGSSFIATGRGIGFSNLNEIGMHGLMLASAGLSAWAPSIAGGVKSTVNGTQMLLPGVSSKAAVFMANTLPQLKLAGATILSNAISGGRAFLLMGTAGESLLAQQAPTFGSTLRNYASGMLFGGAFGVFKAVSPAVLPALSNMKINPIVAQGLKWAAIGGPLNVARGVIDSALFTHVPYTFEQAGIDFGVGVVTGGLFGSGAAKFFPKAHGFARWFINTGLTSAISVSGGFIDSFVTKVPYTEKQLVVDLGIGVFAGALVTALPKYVSWARNLEQAKLFTQHPKLLPHARFAANLGASQLLTFLTYMGIGAASEYANNGKIDFGKAGYEARNYWRIWAPWTNPEVDLTDPNNPQYKSWADSIKFNIFGKKDLELKYLTIATGFASLVGLSVVTSTAFVKADPARLDKLPGLIRSEYEANMAKTFGGQIQAMARSSVRMFKFGMTLDVVGRTYNTFVNGNITNQAIDAIGREIFGTWGAGGWINKDGSRSLWNINWSDIENSIINSATTAVFFGPIFYYALPIFSSLTPNLPLGIGRSVRAIQAFDFGIKGGVVKSNDLSISNLSRLSTDFLKLRVTNALKFGLITVVGGILDEGVAEPITGAIMYAALMPLLGGRVAPATLKFVTSMIAEGVSPSPFETVKIDNVDLGGYIQEKLTPHGDKVIETVQSLTELFKSNTSLDEVYQASTNLSGLSRENRTAIIAQLSPALRPYGDLALGSMMRARNTPAGPNARPWNIQGEQLQLGMGVLMLNLVENQIQNPSSHALRAVIGANFAAGKTQMAAIVQDVLTTRHPDTKILYVTSQKSGLPAIAANPAFAGREVNVLRADPDSAGIGDVQAGRINITDVHGFELLSETKKISDVLVIGDEPQAGMAAPALVHGIGRILWDDLARSKQESYQALRGVHQIMYDLAQARAAEVGVDEFGKLNWRDIIRHQRGPDGKKLADRFEFMPAAESALIADFRNLERAGSLPDADVRYTDAQLREYFRGAAYTFVTGKQGIEFYGIKTNDDGSMAEYFTRNPETGDPLERTIFSDGLVDGRRLNARAVMVSLKHEAPNEVWLNSLLSEANNSVSYTDALSAARGYVLLTASPDGFMPTFKAGLKADLYIVDQDPTARILSGMDVRVSLKPRAEAMAEDAIARVLNAQDDVRVLVYSGNSPESLEAAYLTAQKKFAGTDVKVMFVDEGSQNPTFTLEDIGKAISDRQVNVGQGRLLVFARGLYDASNVGAKVIPDTSIRGVMTVSNVALTTDIVQAGGRFSIDGISAKLAERRIGGELVQSISIDDPRIFTEEANKIEAAYRRGDEAALRLAVLEVNNRLLYEANAEGVGRLIGPQSVASQVEASRILSKFEQSLGWNIKPGDVSSFVADHPVDAASEVLLRSEQENPLSFENGKLTPEGKKFAAAVAVAETLSSPILQGLGEMSVPVAVTPITAETPAVSPETPVVAESAADEAKAVAGLAAALVGAKTRSQQAFDAVYQIRKAGLPLDDSLLQALEEMVHLNLGVSQGLNSASPQITLSDLKNMVNIGTLQSVKDAVAEIAAKEEALKAARAAKASAQKADSVKAAEAVTAARLDLDRAQQNLSVLLLTPIVIPAQVLLDKAKENTDTAQGRELFRQLRQMYGALVDSIEKLQGISVKDLTGTPWSAAGFRARRDYEAARKQLLGALDSTPLSQFSNLPNFSGEAIYHLTVPLRLSGLDTPRDINEFNKLVASAMRFPGVVKPEKLSIQTIADRVISPVVAVSESEVAQAPEVAAQVPAPAQAPEAAQVPQQLVQEGQSAPTAVQPQPAEPRRIQIGDRTVIVNGGTPEDSLAIATAISGNGSLGIHTVNIIGDRNLAPEAETPNLGDQALYSNENGVLNIHWMMLDPMYRSLLIRAAVIDDG
ncbi:MAG: cysteine peptidase family C39 domain-containing protein, partial [Candidatus Omnitrophica bacterium]|nr:cysteine peptidase family C39 domain-containing protein [Candidatus Omnitrophota bacterium]